MYLYADTIRKNPEIHNKLKKQCSFQLWKTWKAPSNSRNVKVGSEYWYLDVPEEPGDLLTAILAKSRISPVKKKHAPGVRFFTPSTTQAFVTFLERSIRNEGARIRKNCRTHTDMIRPQQEKQDTRKPKNLVNGIYKGFNDILDANCISLFDQIGENKELIAKLASKEDTYDLERKKFDSDVRLIWPLELKAGLQGVYAQLSTGSPQQKVMKAILESPNDSVAEIRKRFSLTPNKYTNIRRILQRQIKSNFERQRIELPWDEAA